MKTSVILLLVSLFLFSCTNTPVVELKDKKDNKLSESLINANKYIALSEQTQIDGYVTRRNWNCDTLPCGARLYIQKNGSGSSIKNDDCVQVCYTLSTLTDKILYNEKSDTLVVGRCYATIALDEALLCLRHGSEAIIISPSEAGYGVGGDGNRIPTRTVLVYKLKVE